MSTALYRRYRPDTFADVIGQEHVTEPLARALDNGRINHAHLFSGPRGCGKTTSARILARCLNCEQGPTSTPCGECDSCVALARGGAGSIDVIEIDAASHGGVDDARELRERAAFAPAESRFKVYIIDEAHMVTTQGFNALLKIVEEPPPHVKFVFATTEPEKVIGTIRSRTHHYPFRLVPPPRLHDYLGELCAAEGVAVEPGVLSFVVRAGGGSVRDSLSVLDQLMSGSDQRGLTYDGAAALLGFTDAELLDAVINAFAAADAAEVFRRIEEVIDTGLDPRRFVEDLLERFRDLIVLAAVPEAGGSVLRGLPSDQIDRMRVQAAAFGPGALSHAADVVNAGLTEMTGATAPRLQLELIAARVLLPSAAGERGYAARLDRLERRLEVGGVPSAAAPASPSAYAAPRGATRGAGGPSGGDPRTDRGSPADSQPQGQQAPDAGERRGTDPRHGIGRGAAGPGHEEARQPLGPGPQAVRSDQAPPVGHTPDHAPDHAVAGHGQSGADRDPAPVDAAPVDAAPVDAAPLGSAPLFVPAAGPGLASEGPSDDARGPGAGSRPSAAPTAGGLDVAALRRSWPEVLAKIFTLKRTTWTFLSEYAQVVDYDGRTLVLGIATTGLANTFRSGVHADIVRQALIDVLGLDVRVEVIVGGAASGPQPGPSAGSDDGPRGRSPGGSPGRTAPAGAPDRRGSRSDGADRPPAAGQAPAPSPGAAPSSSPPQSSPPPSSPPSSSRSLSSPSPSSPPADAPARHLDPGRAAGHADRAAMAGVAARDWSDGGTGWGSVQDAGPPSWATGPTPGDSPREQPDPSAPEQRGPGPGAGPDADPASAPVDEEDLVSDDDESLADLGEVGRPVIERLLGGTVIWAEGEEQDPR